MNTRQETSTAQFNRVLMFGEENPSIFSVGKPKLGPSKGQQILVELGVVVGRIGELHAIQASADSVVDTKKVALQRTELGTVLREISRAVKFIAVERKTPAIKSQFRTVRKGSDQLLVANAVSVCNAIEELQLEAELVAMNQPANFLSVLRGRIAQFQRAHQEQSGSFQKKVAATADLNELLARGKILVDGLNVIVTAIFKNDPPKLAAWHTAYRLKRSTHRAAKPVPPAEVESAVVQETAPSVAGGNGGARPEVIAGGRQ